MRRRLARYWLHNGMLNIGGEKMSKSLGNIMVMDDLLAQAPGEAVRLALLQGQYRQRLDFTPDLLTQSTKNLDRLYGVLRDASDIEAAEMDAPEGFMAALCDDLNTPKALPNCLRWPSAPIRLKAKARCWRRAG